MSKGHRGGYCAQPSCWPTSTCVVNVKNNDPSLIEPSVAEAPRTGFSLLFQKSARRQGLDADRASFRQHAAIVGDERSVYRCAQRCEFSIVGV